MSKLNMQSVTDLIEEVFRAFAQMLRHAVRLIGRMSPQALLGAALVLAFVLTILPLALTLFVVFLLIKIAVGACFIGSRRHRRPQEHGQ